MPPKQQPLLEVQGLCKTYTQARWWQRQFRVRALTDVDLILKAGSTLALVGVAAATRRRWMSAPPESPFSRKATPRFMCAARLFGSSASAF